ncbi:HAD-IA family hydrolase [uncultured Veillonella sp.]|uniref:HAD-IA family hydrolase n=1 Tax=uncultured Veillonella sp. TaxID=159268 RepID=UPI0025951610|nr:HAD-IA family hydrolase [uncultured Veillonella sp.]
MGTLNYSQTLIDKYDVITFDVFDTLIVRDVRKPYVVFKLVQKLFNEENQIQSEFFRERIRAEKRARKKAKKNSSYTEVNLDEIYNELAEKFSKGSCQRLKEIEIYVEKVVCTQNREIKSFYDKVINSGKNVYIITDMYLPKSVIDEILADNQFTGYKDIIVSGEYHKTKLQGDLFQYFIETYNLKEKKILHIGDNKLADYDSARRNGIDAYLYSRNKKWVIHAKPRGVDFILNEEYYNLCLFLETHLYKDDHNYFYNCGYSLFGPLIAGYIKWLTQITKEQNIDKILFASRDGFILQKAYDLIDGSKDSSYVYISRKSIITSLLHYDQNLESCLNRYKSWPYKFSFNLFIDKMGIEKKSIPNIESFDLETEFTKEEFLANDKINKQFFIIKPIIDQKSKDAEFLLKEYIKTLFVLGKKSALVDLGGRRTIEKNLREFLKVNHMKLEIYGCYLEIQEETGGNYDAYLFTKTKNKILYYVVSSFYYFLEIILSAPHGSVKGYIDTNQGIVPLFEDYDYDVNDKETHILTSLQKGALDFCKDFRDHMPFYTLAPDTAIRNLKNFGITPSQFDVINWKDFRFNMDLLTPLIHIDSSFSKVLRNPKWFIMSYRRALWKSGVMSLLFGSSQFNWLFELAKVILKLFIKK